MLHDFFKPPPEEMHNYVVLLPELNALVVGPITLDYRATRVLRSVRNRLA